MALSTLADNSVLKTAIQAAFTRRFRVAYLKGTWIIRGGTSTEGPLVVGLAHSDYTIAEIQEATDVSVISSSEKIANERRRRLVRKVGAFKMFESNEQLQGDRGSEKVFTRLNWPIEEDFSLDLWAQNRSGATLTTGAILEFDGQLVGNWQ